MSDNKRGGRREGAGRKPCYHIATQIRMDREYDDRLKWMARTIDFTLGECVEMLLDNNHPMLPLLRIIANLNIGEEMWNENDHIVYLNLDECVIEDDGAFVMEIGVGQFDRSHFRVAGDRKGWDIITKDVVKVEHEEHLNDLMRIIIDNI